jgi:prepilin-type N-terminal cleavage/methylation domain
VVPVPLIVVGDRDMNYINELKIEKHQHGFTLFELMIVVVITAIIVAIAVPSYKNNIIKAKRSTAHGCLVTIAAFMEQAYANQFSYNVDLDLDGTAENHNETVTHKCTEEVSSVYEFSYTAVSKKAFSVQAAPKIADYDGECGTLTISQRGFVTVSGSLGESCLND